MAANTPITIQQLANAQRDATDLEHFVNDPAPAYVPTRLGGNKPNYERLVADFRTLTADMEDQFQAFLLSSGYQDLGDYAAGLQITTRNQIFWRDGELYRAAATLSLPYTASGDWEAEGESFVAVGDAALRQEIAQPSGSTMVGFQQLGSGAVSRSAQDKLRDSASVEDFGATGDGSTDDTEAFRKALAGPSQWVYVPGGGTCVIGELEIPAGKKLYGPGVLKWKGGATAPMITLTGAYAGVEGLKLLGNSANQTATVAMIATDSAPYGFLRNCEATDGHYKLLLTDVQNSPKFQATGNYIHDWGVLVSSDILSFRSSYFQAINNLFENLGNPDGTHAHCIRSGLFNTDPKIPVVGGVIVGNVGLNCEHVGVTVELFTQGLTITGNTFDGLAAGVKIEVQDGTQTDIAITGNMFKNLTLPTCMNLNGRRVTFTGNVCINNAGYVSLGADCIAMGNTFQNCGDATDQLPALAATSGPFSRSIAANNLISNSPYNAMTVGANAVISGNIMYGTVGRNLNCSNAVGARIVNNIIQDGTHGIATNSGTTNLLVLGNNVSGASTANYSIAAVDSTFIDASNSGYGGISVTRVIASDAITAPNNSNVMSITVDTEGGAPTDNLSQINGGNAIGQIICLRTVTGTRVVTVIDNVGNLRLAGDFAMGSSDRLTLMWNGATWDEISRSDN
ncbi:Pectate lyase superfamily protein [Bordetella hinzii]|uniref:Rhamnogalacturonase A/B/Epimerase-like pectate lyase domain-containing protein n=1 Tax=Bordetella hinzii TaxID=103855 RepID=A0AAN1S128_9BORD|nr:right-handed parallel beta-helix repeat-containing protein [Bordetella hinzii]AKQ59744.1 Pectate lyase superfamily protein [Bordetella hinzii]AZW19132.1 hypothetical protein CS347_21415 [Bordetella hinzii]